MNNKVAQVSIPFMLVKKNKQKHITVIIHFRETYLFSSSTGEEELNDDDAAMLHASLSVDIDRVYVALSKADTACALRMADGIAGRSC